MGYQCVRNDDNARNKIAQKLRVYYSVQICYINSKPQKGYYGMEVLNGTLANGNDDARINACYRSIKEKITELRGIEDFYEENEWVAFGGKPENPKLILTVTVIITRGGHYLLADLDGRIFWQEWDYESIDEFENAIANHIAPMIGRKVKTVTEKKRHKYVKVSRYYLDDNKDDNEEWVLIDEVVFDYPQVRLFTFRSSTRTDIKSYI